MLAAMHSYEAGGTQRGHYAPEDVQHAPCPLCEADDPRLIVKERGELGVVRCGGCGAVYVSPRAKDPERNYWGDASAYLLEARLILEGRAAHHRDPNYDDDLRLLARIRPSGRLLDVGTNLGMFLRRARGMGWELHGVEPSPSLARLASQHLEIQIRNGFLEDVGYPDGFFDVVTMTDVLEHVITPYRLLGESLRILRPRGILMVKVPNGPYNEFKLSLARRLGRFTSNDIFDAYEHVVHYSQRTLARTLDRAGFELVKLDVAPPVQIPVWHEFVGQYYLYPSPWVLDWKRHIARRLFYLGAVLQHRLTGRIGALAPNLRAIARKPG